MNDFQQDVNRLIVLCQVNSIFGIQTHLFFHRYAQTVVSNIKQYILLFTGVVCML